MKKIALSVLVAVSLTSSAFADKVIALKAGAADIMNESVPMVFASFGWTKTFSNDLYLGSIYSFGYGSMDQDVAEETLFVTTETTQTVAVGAFDIDIRAGYTLGNVDIYALVGAALQTIDGTSGVGVAFGGGADWRFSQSFYTGIEYKQASMTLDGLADYDYNLISATLGYRW